MATWAEVSSNPIYAALPDEEKRGVADRFFNKVVSTNPTYIALPDEEKQSAKTRFYIKSGVSIQETPKESFWQKIKAPNIPQGVEGFTAPIGFIEKPLQTISGAVERGTEAVEGALKTPGLLQGVRTATKIGTAIFPKSRADIALAVGTLGGSLGYKFGKALISDELLNSAKLLRNAAPEIKAVEIPKLAQKFGEKPVQEAMTLAEQESEQTIAALNKSRLAKLAHNQPKPLPQSWQSTTPLFGQAPSPKPFSLQAGLPAEEQAALDALRAKLPQARPPIVAPEAPALPVARTLPQTATIPPKQAVMEELPPFKARLLEGLKGAEISRKKQELLNAMERSKRTAKLAGVKETGYQGFKAKMGALKGEFEKAEFESIKKNFTQNEVDQMFEHLNKTDKLSGEWERLNAQTALEKLIGAKGAGQIPTNSELSLLSRVYGDDLIAELAAKQGTMEKLWTGAKDVLNMPRALMSTADLSMPLRQGLVLGAGNPKRYAQAFKEMFKYAWDEKAYVGLMDNIRKRPTYDLMRQNGLHITEIGKLGSKEEQFASNLAESIPILGRAVRGSSRAASGFLNKLRADVFDDMVKEAKEVGALTDPTVTKNIARFINIGTGRGEVLDSLKGATEALNATFFSPKLMASRLQMLNPKTYAQLDPFTRKQALKSMRNFLGAGMTVLGIAKAAGAEVGIDPRSADFGKIKIGDTRYDIWGGFQQYMVLASRLASGEMVSSATGKEFKLGEGYKATNRWDISQRFIESKAAPIASFMIGAMKGKTTMGDEFDVPAEVIDRVIPMLAQDYYDLSREYGPVKAAMMATPGVFGVGSQTYGDQVPLKTITKTGKEKIQWKSAPSIGSEVSRIARGEEKSNIPPEEQKSLLEQRRDEALQQIEMDKIRAQVLETGEPQQANGKLVYLERGMVRTKDFVPDESLGVKSLVSGVSAELRNLGIDFTPDYGQANSIFKAVIKNPQYKFATKDQKRSAINRFILSKQSGNK